nr:CrtY [uncultured bacterium]
MNPAVPPSAPTGLDLVLVGGGLQSALIALSVLERRPDASLVMLEGSDRIGGNHTWSFHAGDVPEAAHGFVEPLVEHRWPAYDVAFPGHERRLDQGYATISSDRLAAVVTERLRAAPHAVLHTGARAVEVTGTSVTLDDGRQFAGKAVIDSRGPGRLPPAPGTGFQKFVGLELDLAEPSPRTVPLLMDACVQQTDGFRFFYVLPLAERRVLIEDTYFSDTADLGLAAISREILAYARARGFVVSGVVRRESGALPLPVRALPVLHSVSPLVAGYAGGWFHPATGYSLPAAVRLALHVGQTPAEDLFGADWERLVARHRQQFRFGALLNKMLFTAFAPEDRWNALARFYRMPEATIARFYSLETTQADRLRVLCGRPPRGLSARTAISRGAFA